MTPHQAFFIFFFIVLSIALLLDSLGFEDEAIDLCLYTAIFVSGLAFGAWF